MKPAKAIAILTAPFAITSFALLAGMCLTPYWKCTVNEAISLTDWLIPASFILLLFIGFAAIALFLDFLFIVKLTKLGMYRSVQVAFIGAVVAVLLRIILSAFEGQGIAAIIPQVEYLPFVISGGVFALALDRLVKAKRYAHEV